MDTVLVSAYYFFSCIRVTISKIVKTLSLLFKWELYIAVQKAMKFGLWQILLDLDNILQIFCCVKKGSVVKPIFGVCFSMLS